MLFSLTEERPFVNAQTSQIISILYHFRARKKFCLLFTHILLIMDIFRFENYQELKKDKYLFQLVQNRKLTKLNHRHDFYEIVLIIQGNVTHIVDGIPIKQTENSFLMLSPDNAHFYAAQSKDLKLISLSVLPEKFAEIERATEVSPIFAKPFTFEENIDFWTNELILCSSQVKPQIMNKFLISLFFACWDALKTLNYTPINLHSSLQDMNDKENLKKGVQRWCELAGYSRAQLSRLSKEYYNDTPGHIIRKLKLRTAVKYLKNTTLSAEEIADRSGFESLSRFYVAFKEQYGTTPTKFRDNFSHISDLVEK